MAINLNVDWKEVFKALGLGQIAIQKVMERDIVVKFQTDKVVMTSPLGPKTSVPIPSGAISLAMKGSLQPMSKQNAAQKISSSLNQLIDQIASLESDFKPKKKAMPKKKMIYLPINQASAMYQEIVPYGDLKPYMVAAIASNMVLAVRYNDDGVVSFAVAGGQAMKLNERLVEMGFSHIGSGTEGVWMMHLSCKNDKMLARKSIGAVMFGMGPHIFHSPYPNLESICA
ncbi:MAG: hypothetical protein V3S76_03530 [Candidatus Bipolaricaulota bacterium]